MIPLPAPTTETRYFQKGELLEVINDTAFALDVGEISELVHSEFGFHMLYVYDEKNNERIKLILRMAGAKAPAAKRS